jgi:hypothetical protein
MLCLGLVDLKEKRNPNNHNLNISEATGKTTVISKYSELFHFKGHTMKLTNYVLKKNRLFEIF